MAARLSTLCAGCTIPPGFLRFMVLISVRGWVDPRAIVQPEGLGKFEKIHLIGMRSHDLPACSIVPQPLRYHMPPQFYKFNLVCFGECYYLATHCLHCSAFFSAKVIYFPFSGGTLFCYTDYRVFQIAYMMWLNPYLCIGFLFTAMFILQLLLD
jgi:hypothetical protein